jgi:hypothetical protein
MEFPCPDYQAVREIGIYPIEGGNGYEEDDGTGSGSGCGYHGDDGNGSGGGHAVIVVFFVNVIITTLQLNSIFNTEGDKYVNTWNETGSVFLTALHLVPEYMCEQIYHRST